MIETKNVDQFMTIVMGIVNQIKITGEQIQDHGIVEKVLERFSKEIWNDGNSHSKI